MRRISLLCLAALGCHRASEVTTTSDASASASPKAVASPLIAFAKSPEIAALTRGAAAFEQTAGGLRVRATGSHAIDTFAPSRASEPLRVSLGGGDVFAVSLRPMDARAVTCGPTADARTVVCNEAYRGVDLAIVAAETHAEVFEVLRDPSALDKGHARFAFAFATSPGLFVVQDGARVAIKDKEGTTRFVVPSPYAIDAIGTRREATQRLIGDRLEVDLDAAGLAFPIALDPGLEAATWVDKTPTTRPAAIHYINGFYDSVRKKTVFYGGNSAGVAYSSSWEWNGTALTTAGGLGLALHSAPGVFATKRGVGWTFGGQNGSYSQDRILEFDGTVWTATSPSPRPSERHSFGIAYDEKRDVIVLFGGLLTTGSYWVLNGDTWEHSGSGFTVKSPMTVPTKRWATQMGYDAKRSVVVMFGGQTGTSSSVNSTLGDTWEWDGTDWKAMTPTASPPPLAGGALIWDDVGQRLVLVGGNSVDNWAYDGVTWAKLTTTGFPRRMQGAFVYDSTRKTVVTLGGHSSSGAYYGTNGAGSPGTIYDTILEWQITSCTTSTDCGSGGTCVAGHCCATSCAGACQTCAPDGVCNTLPVGATPTDPTCLMKCDGAATCPTTCTADSDCKTGSRCSSGNCIALKPLGGVCTTAAECASSACVDGFCCDRPCAGTCEACDVAGKIGRCTTLAKDATPHGTRACAGTGVCAGTCGGTSPSCDYAPSTQQCALAGCVGDTLSQAGYCDGAGSCAKPGPVKCAPYLCVSSACTTSCTTNTDCAAGGYCTFGKCLNKKAEGASCTVADECLSGTCVGGLCSMPVDAGPDTFMPDTFEPDTFVADTFTPDTAVEDTGSAPVDTGAVEDVIATTPAPPITDPKVPAEFTRCTKASDCSTGFCVDGVCCNTACEERCHSCALLTSPGICTEEPEGVDLRNECGPANTCLGTCGKGGKCIGAGSGTMCAANRCVSASTGVGPAYCPAPGAKCPTDTATPFDCAPYTCEPAFGACRTMCKASSDCANGFVCDIDKKSCVAPPAPAAAEDGGCAMGHSNSVAGAWALLTLAAALTARKRRQS